jgi:hypothetical protein
VATTFRIPWNRSQFQSEPPSLRHDPDEGGDGDAEGLKRQRAATTGCWPGRGSARRARRLHRQFHVAQRRHRSDALHEGGFRTTAASARIGATSSKAKLTARYADRDEVFEAGDAFYSPPGHVPVANEPGTEFVWFSRSEELRTAEAVMMKNMQAMQEGSAP